MQVEEKSAQMSRNIVRVGGFAPAPAGVDSTFQLKIGLA
jgi:hypothetical protein